MTVTIVTGSSRGLGQSIAKLIITNSPSSKVVLAARSKQQLETFPNLFPEESRNDVLKRSLIVPGDLNDKDSIEKLIEKTVSKFGRIDSIVFNAGVLEPVDHIIDVDVDQMKKLFDINFFSVIKLLQLAIPHLRESAKERGTPSSCIFVSSGASIRTIDGWLGYGASKSALNHLAMDLSIEEAPLIRSISVAPGVVDTEMQRTIREEAGKKMKPDQLKRFTDLYEKGELLPADVPGEVYARLALGGISEGLNGRYMRYNSDELSKGE
ncbi:DEKNAAC102673 [Brettanomyces naardenensis]|uniref:DEKNAAC102673 n=1 Tax=Brettanomyces naardenensis TaxID=13370 RepID=A0A448YLN8_BRENA|nr:DEKNAAC102673 [Brettanomyces naardenensis]